MDVTIDIKTFFIVLVLIALVILIVYGIMLLRKLLVTIERTNKVLEDVEKISELAASRSQDLDGIVDNVSVAASELSGAMSGGSFIGTVSSVAKSAASLKGLFSEGSDTETRAAKKREKKAARSKK
ncbi:MAG: hypothetical protein IJ109_07950 [Firmicutes bacterium]|nr:hypothetical protein [Bacillota bacterium]